MGAAVVHWEVRARDSERLKKFYGDLFGWAIDSNNPMKYGMVDTGLKQGINGGIGGGDPHFAAGVTIYVQVEDPQAYLTRIESMGGKALMMPMEIPGDVTMALFSDPEGNVIGLVKGSQTDTRSSSATRPSRSRRSPAPRKRTPARGRKRKRSRR